MWRTACRHEAVRAQSDGLLEKCWAKWIHAPQGAWPAQHGEANVWSTVNHSWHLCTITCKVVISLLGDAVLLQTLYSIQLSGRSDTLSIAFKGEENEQLVIIDASLLMHPLIMELFLCYPVSDYSKHLSSAFSTEKARSRCTYVFVLFVSVIQEKQQPAQSPSGSSSPALWICQTLRHYKHKPSTSCIKNFFPQSHLVKLLYPQPHYESNSLPTIL